jgi:serine-type D-Ala-D-Ala carboxypeptidase (penicillin-binding protein 5/6)
MPGRVSVLVLGLVVICAVGVALWAAGLPGSDGAPAREAAGRASAPAVKAWSGIVIERDTGVVLWSKNPARRLPPASCTKIMTAVLVLEHVADLRWQIRVAPEVAAQKEVVIGLRPGDRITVEQALRALMVKSANDAAVALACYVAGSEARFVRLMNARAARLGLRDTHFENSRGKPAPLHLSSARDLAKLGRFAMRDARFRDLVKTQSAIITWPPDHAVRVDSHNRLLNYSWADGIKTGATSASGKVLVGSGQPGSVPLIVVTMHEPSRDQEEKDAVALFMWASALPSP